MPSSETQQRETTMRSKTAGIVLTVLGGALTETDANKAFPAR